MHLGSDSGRLAFGESPIEPISMERTKDTTSTNSTAVLAILKAASQTKQVITIESIRRGNFGKEIAFKDLRLSTSI